ncbi:hypothetical protein CXB51_006455 [Gossypium anomalum]|uniref:WRKY domain-containing protein n=1 Tax=Gossypium anomalum TaxID=47600 RepID=A0A8J5ZJB1_9ROSI|nr:hypothetical protein CXB51_006455 [Gossypium anomalum]
MSWNTKKAIEELVRGKELTKQLRDLLTKSLTDDGFVNSEDLVLKICDTFANTLSLLTNSNTTTTTAVADYYYNDDLNDVSQKPTINITSDGRKSEDSGDSIKSPPSTHKDRRGSYKRRKCVDSRKKITSALVDDGYAWRKYGQKQILHASHPRSYFRCTHKTDQGCQATKQVQKLEDDPPKYETIYYGHHTCKNMLKSCHFMVDDSTCNNDSSILLSFANNSTLTNKQGHDNPFFSSVKQESKEDYKPISEITYNGSSSPEYLWSPHHHQLSTFDLSSADMTVLSPDHDVLSDVVDSVDLDDLLQF